MYPVLQRRQAVLQFPPSFFNLGFNEDDELYQSLEQESCVNGFWIAVLSKCFPPPRHFVQPNSEVKDSSGVDLLVTKLGFRSSGQAIYTPIIVFKGEGVDHKKDQKKENLTDHIRTCAADTTRKHNLRKIWCIGAKGRSVCFYYFGTTSVSWTMRPLRVDDDMIVRIGKIDDSQAAQYFDLSEFAKINAAFTYIVNDLA
ncbi:hypothetical protein RhiXN_11763 [Rhizoctonia solani]|uniref:Uncharacterized protein n=1 Tax=Rhizoctonia solani TaxID=456999 RepID=A0A8H7M5Q8_9AGAM|nr:uncharacterized protein RhiXN_11763 [Rhizoctonia solani]KAF8756158.1 hypothetical protein RHS01_04983 [Rhizoctonia solani]QRW24851.1 hypothetical protein RhiXN_11763 [Rhizoctonia solani]